MTRHRQARNKILATMTGTQPFILRWDAGQLPVTLGDGTSNAYVSAIGNVVLTYSYVAAVPEPSTMLLTCGALTFGLLRRRRSPSVA